MFFKVQSFTVMSSIDTSGTTDGGCVWIGWDSGGNGSWCCHRLNDCWGGGGNSSWCCDRVNNCWGGVFMYFTWMDSHSLTTFKTTNIVTFSIRPLGETVKTLGVFLRHEPPLTILLHNLSVWWKLICSMIIVNSLCMISITINSKCLIGDVSPDTYAPIVSNFFCVTWTTHHHE